MIKAPTSVAAITGWLGAAFLAGIVAHSIWPYKIFSYWGIFSLGFLAINIALVSWKQVWIRTIALCVLVSVIGFWKFESVRTYLPRNLKPFSAKNLAYERNEIKLGDSTDPRYWLGRLRLGLNKRAAALFEPAEGALLTGILYGERALPKENKEQFRKAGLLHIIAVSGSNMTILAVLVMRSLLLFPLRRKTAFSVFSIILVAYVFFVSPSPSVVRAAFMGWLVELAPIVGRIPRTSRLLLLAAVFFSWLKPWALMYDASFALSFLAMWGLLTFGKEIGEWLKQKKVPQGVSEIMSATIGATILTSPYTTWAFGQFSIWGLLTSLLALPLIPWVMGLGMLALLLPVPYVFTLPTSGFLKALLAIGKIPDVFQFGVWSNLSTSFWSMAGIYGLLWLIWREYKHRKGLIHQQNGALANLSLTDRAVLARADRRNKK